MFKVVFYNKERKIMFISTNVESYGTAKKYCENAMESKQYQDYTFKIWKNGKSDPIFVYRN